MGFAQPQRLFSLCEQAELVSPQWEGGAADHTDLNVRLPLFKRAASQPLSLSSQLQRKALLFVAVDHGLVAMVRQCMELWRGGGGECSPQLVATWVSEKMREISEEKNALCR